MTALALAARTVADLTPVGLDEVLERAALQERIDTKFIVDPTVLDRLVGETDLDALEIDGTRQFAYGSMYFDTPEWLTYREHTRGRRRRFKARTRHYLDTGTCMFEVKLEGARGGTDKHRVPHEPGDAGRITRDAWAHLARTLDAAGMTTPGSLVPAVHTAYHRITLVAPDRPSRLTVDAALRCRARNGASVTALHDRVLLEVKTPTEQDPVLRTLYRLGAQPVSVSKYCAGVALLHPELPRAPWLPVLRRHFGAAAGIVPLRAAAA